MSLKIPLSKLSSQAFVGGFRTLRSSRFGRADAWAIYRAGEHIDRELARYFSIRKEIEERFARTEGQMKFIPRESVQAFQEELAQLGRQEVELSLGQKIVLPEDCTIQPDELGALVEAGLVHPPELTDGAPPTVPASPSVNQVTPNP